MSPKCFARLAAAVLFAATAAVTHAAKTLDARPNVIVILADDMGFSDLGCYGGEIHTPHIDGLAKNGTRFAQFYNMARCCPTRASLLTGVYPHQAGIGAMNQNLGKPAYQGELNDHCVTIPEVLKEAGYQTGMVGKWHLTHLTISEGYPHPKRLLNFEEEAPISPSKANWPCNRGFQEHWGTIPGVDSYYDPYGLVHNEETIKPEGKDFYYTDFLADHAVQMIDQFSSTGKPFFMYVSVTAPHWPLQAPEADVEPYLDTYKVGWDEIREQRFRRLVDLGLVKESWGLSPRPDYPRMNDGASRLAAWEDAPAKEWQARRMAVYAGQITHLDRGVGRILDALKDKHIDDNTVVIFLSDNGGCAENVQPGWYDIPSKTRDGRTIHVGDDPKFMPGPETVYQSYGPAWANASNTPFRRFKHWAEEGGISAPFIVRWPGVTTEGGKIEHEQVGDVIDLMPTILDITGAKYPATHAGHPIPAEEGKSLVPILRGEKFDRGALCWEHEGNRAVRVGDWKLVAAHGEAWQLYNIVEDRTELHDRAAEMPEKVKELKQAYDEWAARCGVEPWPVKKK